MSDPRDWLRFPVLPDLEEAARLFTLQKDHEHLLRTRNWVERTGDEPWIGAAAEMLLDWWLTAKHVPHRRIIDNDHEQPDFRIRRVAASLKCSKRDSLIEPHFETGMKGFVVEKEPGVLFLFALYEIPTRTMIYPGGFWRYDFISRARYFGPGERVHAKFIVPRESNVYNVYLHEMVDLRSLLDSTSDAWRYQTPWSVPKDQESLRSSLITR
jgi:hypothetical protein